MSPINPNDPYQQTPIQQPSSMPYFLDPNGPYAHVGEPPLPRRKRKGLGLVLSLFALLIVGGIVALIYLGNQGGSPNEIFQTALANSLSTRSYTQKQTSDSGSLALKYDVSDVKNAKVSGTATIKDLGYRLDGYADSKNGYNKFTELNISGNSSSEDTLSFPTSLINKWVQVRKDGALPQAAGDDIATDQIFDGPNGVLGDIIIGNFNDTDKQALLKTMQDKSIYTFAPESVKEVTVGGQPATQFEVTINSDALAQLNKQAAKIIGLSDDEADLIVARFAVSGEKQAKATLFIGAGSQRFIKANAKLDDSEATIEYSSFNATTVTAEPTPDLQYDEFTELLFSATDANASLGGKAADTERTTDVSALDAQVEAYYAQYGSYPSLANMNDPTWRAQYLKGLNDVALADPEGTTKVLAAAPTPKQYSYQAFQDSGLGACTSECQEFKLSATLSDGKVYTKTSYN